MEAGRIEAMPGHGSNDPSVLRRPVAALVSALLGLCAAPPSLAQQRPEAYVVHPPVAAPTALRAELGEGFRVVETEHFRVISDTSVRYHTVVAGVLEQFYQIVHPRFFVHEIAPVDFYLINDGRDYEAFMRRRGLPNTSGYGLYDSRTRSLYARRYFPDGRESGVGTLYHEAVHAMIDADFADSPPPLWINEGFASLFEAGRVIRAQWVYGNPNPWRETPFRAAFERGRVPSLAALLLIPDAAFAAGKEQRDLLYNSGRSLFLYILRSLGEAVLAEFVRRVRGGAPPADALAAATGLSLPEIERGWRASIQQVNFGGDYLNRATGPDALQILEAGARLHPDYGNLQLQLALEYLKQRDSPSALEHAQRALEDPHLTSRQLAHYVVGRALLTTDPGAAARALQMSISFQPWNERILGEDYELLAFMFEKIGDSDRAAGLRAELAKMRAEDQL